MSSKHRLRKANCWALVVIAACMVALTVKLVAMPAYDTVARKVAKPSIRVY